VTALVELSGIRVHYPAKPNPVRAVDGVDLTIADGETLALVGESGCGKSTLARALAGLEAPTGGAVRFLGEPLPAFPSSARRARCKHLQMVFQDPDASLNPRMTIQSAIGEPLELHERLERAACEARVLELMQKVGLDPALRLRYPHELSGGQRQRVCIARAIAVRPKLLICDEAVSALDVSVQAQILNLLLDLKQTFALSYLFITHDLRVVRHVADRVAVMYLGQIVEIGPTDDVFGAPAHPYTRALLASVPAIGTATSTRPIRGEPPSPANPPPGCRFQTRCPEVFDRCPKEMPELYRIGQREARCFLVDSEERGA
jgi:oligopeptide/dipeptide ABC transporter ATP-binding protein